MTEVSIDKSLIQRIYNIYNYNERSKDSESHPWGILGPNCRVLEDILGKEESITYWIYERVHQNQFEYIVYGNGSHFLYFTVQQRDDKNVRGEVIDIMKGYFLKNHKRHVLAGQEYAMLDSWKKYNDVLFGGFAAGAVLGLMLGIIIFADSTYQVNGLFTSTLVGGVVGSIVITMGAKIGAKYAQRDLPEANLEAIKAYDQAKTEGKVLSLLDDGTDKIFKAAFPSVLVDLNSKQSHDLVIYTSNYDI